MPDSSKEPKDTGGWGQMASYAQLAMLLPAATFVGWLIGVALDHWLHTTWLYILGLILGIVAGFMELIRTVVKDSKNA
jgi:F0F1-type ATP synthase assembly protein I